MMEGLESRFVNHDGVKIHYWVGGTGDPVILLHGFPEFSYSWRKQVPALIGQYRVIVPDLRGYNLSGKPKGWKNYSFQTIANDIRAILWMEKIPNARIVAHDWGGMVAFELAIQSPKDVKQLVILNSPHPMVMSKHLRHNRKQKLRSWYMWFFQIPWLPEALIRLFLPIFTWYTFKSWIIDKSQITKVDLKTYAAQMRQKGSLHGMINYYRAAFRHRLFQSTDYKKPISVPTLVLWGMKDKALGPELADDFAPYFSGPFQLVKLENCSHWVQTDQPEKVNQALLQFFAGFEAETEGR